MQQGMPQSVLCSDETPFAQCYALYAIPLLTYVRQRVPSKEDAEDIVIEVFIAALEQKRVSLIALNRQEQLAWLRRVAYYKCMDRHRRLVHRSIISLEEPGYTFLEEDRLSPEQVVLRREEQMLLRKGLNRLPEHYQTILRLRFADGLPNREIARLLQKSEGSVRALLFRALNTLRKVSIVDPRIEWENIE